jgi:hypothetical protein
MKLNGIILIFIVIVILIIIGIIVKSALLPSQKITNFEECIDAGNPAMESYPRQCRDSESDRTFTEETRIVVSLPCEADELNCNNFKNQQVAQDMFEACGGVGFDIHKLDPDENGIACEDFNYNE